jgi:hypothetical protein
MQGRNPECCDHVERIASPVLSDNGGMMSGEDSLLRRSGAPMEMMTVWGLVLFNSTHRRLIEVSYPAILNTFPLSWRL